MNIIPAPPPLNEATLLALATEIAADLRDLPDILKSLKVSDEQWELLSSQPRFLELVRTKVSEWESAGNTAERVRLKALAFVEQSLPEFYARAHDPKEALPAKVEVLKTVSRFAGIGVGNVEGAASERMVVNINLGADHKLSFSKDVTSKVTAIEGELVE